MLYDEHTELTITHMRVDDESIQYFQTFYREHFGMELTRDEAAAEAARLFRLLELLVELD